jgi:hypothetical protein
LSYHIINKAMPAQRFISAISLIFSIWRRAFRHAKPVSVRTFTSRSYLSLETTFVSSMKASSMICISNCLTIKRKKIPEKVVSLMTQATTLCCVQLFVASISFLEVRAQKWVGTQELAAKGEKAPFGRSNYKHYNPAFKGGVGCASLALDNDFQYLDQTPAEDNWKDYIDKDTKYCLLVYISLLQLYS